MQNLSTVDAVSTTAPSTSARRLVAAGVKRGSGPLVVESAPLPPAALQALDRLELAFADRTVANFDSLGSLWGFDTVETAEKGIVEARAEGAVIDEWDVTDRDGQPLRVVRLADPTFLDTICVFSAWPAARKSVA